MVTRLIPRRSRRRSVLLGSCLTLCLFMLIIYNRGRDLVSRDIHTNIEKNINDGSATQNHPLLEQQVVFWRSFFHLILNNDPQCEKAPEIISQARLDIAYHPDYVRNRPDLMSIRDVDVQRLKKAHAKYLQDLDKAKIKLVYQKETRGIITTVSDTQLPVLLVSLRMLRKSGSKLPVEVFLWQSMPYTTNLCNKVLPTLNASCIYLSAIFTEASTGVGLKAYQHKIFAILFSSFDEVLFLDSDTWPTANPDLLFTSTPFTDTGMILWPDFWYASESPYFFDIANIKSIPALTDRAATEAGQIMYSKSRHEASIMLAAYYNYYGPEYYYSLQSQGAPGQGDKETFGLAALALQKSFYTVKTPVTAIGRTDSTGRFLGSAMVQYDPQGDYIVQEEKKKKGEKATDSTSLGKSATVPLKETTHEKDTSPPSVIKAAYEFTSSKEGESDISKSSSSEEKEEETEEEATSNVNPQFIHVNFPKFDPRTILQATYTVNDDNDDSERTSNSNLDQNQNQNQNKIQYQNPGPTIDSNGTKVKPWDITTTKSHEKFNYDIQTRLWGVILKVACGDLIGDTNTNTDINMNTNINTDRNKDVDGYRNGDVSHKVKTQNEKGSKERKVCDDIKRYISEVFEGVDFGSV